MFDFDFESETDLVNALAEVWSGQQASRGANFEFEFQTDLIDEQVEAQSGQLASRGADFEFEFESDPVDNPQPAINTQETFHPAFCGLATQINLNLNLKLIRSTS